MSSPKKYLGPALTFLRIALTLALFLYSVGFIVASLLYDGARYFSDSFGFDPFDSNGVTHTWINVSIWTVSLALAVVCFFLYRLFFKRLEERAHPFRRTYSVTSLIILFAISAVANEAAWFSVAKLELANKRLNKLITLHGPKEDMCRVLKLGMSKDELVSIMGLPSDVPTLPDCHVKEGCGLIYCPEVGDCRSVTLSEQQKIVKIECWNGKAQGLPIQ
ncbi:MAG: hypothetical protein H7249_09245 [Chitinophagaceae bacterium]|nr:hypothetical protein [Oligoflexus sp.]